MGRLQKVKARFDGSHQRREDGDIIGIGYMIGNKRFKERYIAGEKLDSSFAELLALMSLVQELLQYKNCAIYIEGDNQDVVRRISKKRLIKNHEIQSEYIILLLEELKQNNHVQLTWICREKNHDCDALASHLEKFIFKYRTITNTIRKRVIYDHFADKAQETFHQWLQSNPQFQSVNI